MLKNLILKWQEKNKQMHSRSGDGSVLYFPVHPPKIEVEKRLIATD